MEWLYIILAVVVLIAGLGVIAVNRMRTRGKDVPPQLPPGRTYRPSPTLPGAEPGARAGTDVLDRPGTVLDEPAAPAPTEPAPAPAPVKPSFRDRMSKARSALAGALAGVRSRDGISTETWEDLEEALLRADVGVRVGNELLDSLQDQVRSKQVTTADQLLDALQGEMTARLRGADRALHFDDTPGGPNVWLFVGVNGVGKTTTIGKVAAAQRAAGRSVLLAAGETFSAAAAEQLTTWAERSGAEIVRGNEGGDPGAVIFDAIESASAKGVDLVLGDTAGRLHTKTNLMDELGKIRRVAAKGAGRVTEVLLVIDATTGQNGLAQAREFSKATQVAPAGGSAGSTSGITGVVLTKLDGSAKGGIVFAIETEMGVPVKLVGLGETIDDLVPFDPGEFVAALFDAS